MARFLTNVAQFPGVSAYLGSVVHHPSDGPNEVMATAFAFTRNQGDAWEALLTGLVRELEDVELTDPAGDTLSERPFAFPVQIGERLGRRTGELHCALATPTDDSAFSAEPITRADVQNWVAAATAELDHALERLAASRQGLPEEIANLADALTERRDALVTRLERAVDTDPSGAKTRIHGDYHLGQVLVAGDDLVIIDFEGEPSRPIEERRAKSAPLRDVAGMLRSIDYLAEVAIQRHAPSSAAPETAMRRAKQWSHETRAAFLDAYFAATEDSTAAPQSKSFASALLDLFLIEKAAYEVAYELANRPDWVGIPLRGLLELADGPETG